MPITNKYRRIPLDQIFVERDERQRTEIDTTDIDDSIRNRGVIQPILVQWDETINLYRLIAGERRFTSSKKLNIPDIPSRLVHEVDPIELQILELEENVKRKDLDWKDETRAVRRIHILYCELNTTWTQAQTASSIGMNQSIVAMMIRVAEEILAGNKLVLEAQGYRPAYNIISRHEGIQIADAMNDLLSEGLDVVAGHGYAIVGEGVVDLEEVKSAKPGGIIRVQHPQPIPNPISPETIVQTDFVKWAEQYRGKPFSFIHCDFPYGLNLDKSEQANTKTWGGYEDSEATYWTLCRALCDNIDRVMMQSGHLLFWCSSDCRMMNKTLDFFQSAAPSLDFVPIPIIWHKTDGKGILSDHRRRARHVYETALIASRGDRHILRSVGDAYGAPTSKEIHQSEKPEPVLRHFFAMFVDENTRMLDPTCGSGSSIRAAESLSAAYTFGLEINGDTVAAARTALRRSRLLRGAERKSSAAEGM